MSRIEFSSEKDLNAVDDEDEEAAVAIVGAGLMEA